MDASNPNEIGVRPTQLVGPLGLGRHETAALSTKCYWAMGLYVELSTWYSGTVPKERSTSRDVRSNACTLLALPSVIRIDLGSR